MTKTGITRVLATGFALCLLAAVLLSVFFLAVEIHHDCHGDHCPVCEEIKVALSLLSGLKSALLIPLLFWGLRRGVCKIIALYKNGVDTWPTPVDLQVKLLS